MAAAHMEPLTDAPAHGGKRRDRNKMARGRSAQNRSLPCPPRTETEPVSFPAAIMISPRPALSPGSFLAFRAGAASPSPTASPPPSPRLHPSPAPPLSASFSPSAAAASTRDHTAAGSSFYDVLGLRPGASAREIKAAYRRLVRAVHPDAAAASHSSAEDFMRVHAAYATLSDPDRRADYDRRLLLASAAGGPAFGRSTSFPARRRPRTWETDQCW